MKILLLSPHQQMVPFLESFGDEVTQITERLDDATGYDWIVSYGYRFRVTEEMLDQVNRQAVNLHISYLPWNRGADPTFWSVAEDTPRGVTIHVMDGSIDTGPVSRPSRACGLKLLKHIRKVGADHRFVGNGVLDLTWDDDKWPVEEIVLTLNSNVIFVDGEERAVEQAPVAMVGSNRSVIPVHGIFEPFGISVGWVEKAKQVILRKGE